MTIIYGHHQIGHNQALYAVLTLNAAFGFKLPGGEGEGARVETSANLNLVVERGII